MHILRSFLLVAITAGFALTSSAQEPETEIDTVLDQLHAAAAAGDWTVYFALWSDDGVFLGTDASERWTIGEFRQYASGRSGWTYVPRERHVNLTPDGNSAWFDELLDSASYGTSRGTGVLIRTRAGWKVSQYHLTFPIPNALSREITDSIKRYEATQ